MDMSATHPPNADGLIAHEIFERYRTHYGGEAQGCCLLIADEVQRAVGGELVAGELVYPGSNRRTHWWVEKNGVTLDPMGDWMFAPRISCTGKRCIVTEQSSSEFCLTPRAGEFPEERFS